MSAPGARRVVVVAWDNADWRAIDPLMDAGQMPALQSLVERGVRSNLLTLARTPLPLLWTTVASGHVPERHGILTANEPDPATGSIRPASPASRGVKAIWNILSESGLRSVLVNWPVTQPAEPIHGVCVSDAWAVAHCAHTEHWPVAAGAVHPPGLRDALAGLRVHPSELTGDDLLPFVPDLGRIDQTADKRPARLAVELARLVSVHGAATWLMENEAWDFAAVSFGSLGGIFEDEPDSPVLAGMHRYRDLMLRRLIDLAGPDTTFVVLSTDGFHAGQPAMHGIFCAAGPGLRRDELAFGAGLLDVTPFLLRLFDLPAGEDMPGRIITDAFESASADHRIPTWERPVESAAQEWDADGVLAELAALGYAEPAAAPDPLREQNQFERRYQQAKLHLLAGRYAEAIPVLEQLAESVPLARLLLSYSYLRVGRAADARAVADAETVADPEAPYPYLLRAAIELAERRPWNALLELERAEGKPLPDGLLPWRIGRVYLQMGRPEDAEQSFARAVEIAPRLAPAHTDRAQALLQLRRHQEAAESALDAIALRYDDGLAHFVLGVSLAGLKRTERAVQAFETSLRFRPSEAARSWLGSLQAAS